MAHEMPRIEAEREKARAEARRQFAALELFKASGLKDGLEAGGSEAVLKAKLTQVKRQQAMAV